MRCQSPSVVSLAKRRRFRNLQATAPPLLSELTTVSNDLFSGSLDVLSDELVGMVMCSLAHIPAEPHGLRLRAEVLSGARNIRCLLLSCRRIGVVLRQCRDLHMEMLARASTQVIPRSLDTEFPFTQQVALESRSSDQLNLLRSAIDGLATHCAGKCCRANLKAVNREAKKNARVSAVLQRSSVVAASLSGEVAFLASREKLGPARYEERIYRARVCDVKAALDTWTVLPADAGDAPHSMCSNPSGTAVAVLRGFHAHSSDASVPHSTVQVWTGGEKLGPRVACPFEMARIGAVNAQSTWWLCVAERPERLVVLWSTAYVHPMGSIVGSNADSACFGFGIYEMEGDFEHLDFVCGPFHGEVQTANPTANGSEAVVLSLTASMGQGPGAILQPRSSCLINLLEDRSSPIDHSAVVGGNRRVLELLNCPSAAALSPAGDCVVAVHRSRHSSIVEVLVRSSQNCFVSVQTIDVTHWTASIHTDDYSGLFAEEGMQSWCPNSVVFSPCGRFAAVVDQGPMYGMSLANHGIVVLDMALRQERRGVRAMPLAPAEEVAPRSVTWTETGIWVQARHGALFLATG